MKKHPIKKLFRHVFKTAWWKPNKESQKMLRKEADELIGWDKRINPCWDKSWKYFIKRQYPWCGLIELIQFKIIEMRDYMQNHADLVPEEVNRQVKEMTEVIDLGNKILENKYEDEPYRWLLENNCNITIIKMPGKGEVAKLYNRSILEDLVEQFDLEIDDKRSVEAEQRLQEFLKDKDTRSVSEWLKDNNLTKRDISIGHTGVWTNGKSDEENHDEYMCRFKAAADDRQNDISKYFESIGDYYWHWGD